MSDDGSPAASPSKNGTRNNRKARRLAARQREADEKAQELKDTTNDVMEFMGTFQDGGPPPEDRDDGTQLFYVDTKPGGLPKGFVVKELEQEKRVPDYVGNEGDVQEVTVLKQTSDNSDSEAGDDDGQDALTVQAVSTANNTAGETDNDNDETDAGQVSGLLQDEFDATQDEEDAGPAETREAIRYFKEDDPLQICQRCGESGHSVRKCEHIQCNTCGKLDDHGTRACPLTMICFRCQSRGHHIKDCPVDLSKAPSRLANSQCSRCSSRLHSSSNCPYIWRVYIRAPNAPSGSSIPKIHFACYNCASAEHFGDDCKLPRAHPVKAIDRSAFTSDTNKIYRGAPAGRQSETDSFPDLQRDRLPRPNIVNGIRQDRPPPNAPKGPKGKGKMRKQTLEEEIQDLKDDDEEEDMWKRLNNNVNERTGNTTRGEGRQNTSARGGAQARRGRGSWEPFKNRPRGRDRSRSPERRQHMRFSDSDSRPPPRNDSYIPPSRDDNRHDRKNEPRGPGGRQRSPDFPRSGYHDTDAGRSRGPPALLDRISRGRELAKDDRSYHSDSYRPNERQHGRYTNDRPSGGRYRGGYV